MNTGTRPLESDRILPGLKKLGIGAGCQIVISDTPDLAEDTAAHELRGFLRRGTTESAITAESGCGGGQRILLGRAAGVRAIREWAESGQVRILDVSGNDDGFHVKKIGGDVVVAGANPRGVLHGVYALEEYVLGGAAEPLDIRRVPAFRKRGSGVSYFFNPYFNVSSCEFTPEKADYLARLGVNQYTGEDFPPRYPYFRDSAPVFHLHQLVSGGVFPFQPRPVPEFVRKIRSMSSLCARYGIDFYLELWEPVVPSVTGDPSLYPPEALGWVRRPWGGGEGNLDRTLCVSSPLVRAHYREMMGRFVREYPDVKGVTFYNMDGSTWLCTPELCPRCAGELKDSPAHIHNPWETQAQFATLLREAAHAERPDFDFRFWPVHYSGEASAKLCAAVRCDSMDMSWNNSDRELTIPRSLASPRPEFQQAHAAAAERGVPLYALCEFNGLESIQRGLPFPFHVADALKRYHAWGINHINEWTGPLPEQNPVNALVMRAFQADPAQDAEAFLRDLARRQFGGKAGGLMVRAWERMRDAFDAWDGYEVSPLSGSQPYLGVGTTSGLPLPILPGIEERYEYDLAIRTNVEPFRAADYQRFREPKFLEDLERMSAALCEAARLAERAVAAAPGDEEIGVCLYMGPEDGYGRPTRREYAEMNHAAIAVAALLCRQRVSIVRAVRLLNAKAAREAAGDAAGARGEHERYLRHVRADVALQGEFAALLERLYARRPHIVRTGMPAGEIEDFLIGTRGKIERLREYLAAQ